MSISQVDVLAAAIALLILFITMLIADTLHAQTTDVHGLDHGSTVRNLQGTVISKIPSDAPEGNVARNFQPFSRDQVWIGRLWRFSEATTIAAAAADGVTTNLFLTNGSGCTESFPGIRGHASELQVWGYGALAHGAGFALEELLHRRHRRSIDAHVAMIFINAGATAAHVIAAHGNTHCL